MADTADAPAPAPTRPTKPDEALYNENYAKADKEYNDAMAQFNAIKQKIGLASSNRNSDNPTAKRAREIDDRIKEIKSIQGVGKNSRTAKQDEIKRLEAQLKSKKEDLKVTKEMLEGYYTLEGLELESRGIEERFDEAKKKLEAKIASGTQRLALEKDTVARLEILDKVRRANTIKNQQQAVDDVGAKIKEVRDSMNTPEAKELSEEYTKLQAEQDAIKAEQNKARGSLNSLYDEKRRLQIQQQEKWEAKQKLQDEYYQQRNAFRKYENEQRQKARERMKAERDRIEKEHKMERAQKMLAEASDPAYLDEIRRANSLLQYFDPSFVAEKAPLQPSTNLQAQAERKVDASDLEGVKILSKKDRDEDLFPAQKKGKKGKKGKKHNAAATKSTTFNCPPSVLEDCSYMGIDPPMSADEVPGVIEKVKAKLDHWKADQAAQTQKNIEKAKKEIEKIEAEEAKEKGGKKSSSGAATPNGNENGAASDEEKPDDKVEEVAKEVEETSIEDKQEEEAVAAA